MRVLVTGSRDWRNESMIRRALNEYPPGTVLVHGNQRGADRTAQRIGRELGFTDEPHSAKWRLYGKKAGPIRNGEMVGLGADICHAFPGPESVGTWDCVERCRRAGIPVRVWQS